MTRRSAGRITGEVERLLSPDGPVEASERLAVLAAYAGEILGGDDQVDAGELADALSDHVVADGPSTAAAEAVLAMVRTWSLRRRMGGGGPMRAPRRSYDTR